MTMNPDIRTEWVRRLLSGDYQQGSQYLNFSNEKHCCLGVLCEMAVEAGVVTRVENPDTVGEGTLYYYRDSESSPEYSMPSYATAYPPAKVATWAGLDATDPSVTAGFPELAHLSSTGKESWTLSELNDETELGFDGIATVIEKYL